MHSTNYLNVFFDPITCQMCIIIIIIIIIMM